MDLRSRLRAITGARPLDPPPPLRRQVGIERVVPGSEVANEHGVSFVVEHRFPLGHEHGAPIAAYATHQAAQLAALTGDRRLAGLDPARAVILDTETTGLAGGTGTYVFLVGLGLIEADSFVVRQYFLRELIEERALLAALAEHLTSRGGIVTYNGRCFDWPLLATRFTITRLRSRLPDLPHWDVLPLARRLWRPRLGACNLSALEARLLAQPRADDTPGWLIPQLYFDYLRDGDARRLTGIFEHNRRDILALAALAGRICHILTDPFGGSVSYAQDFASLARLAESAGQVDQAIALYRQALEGDLPTSEREAAQHQLSLLLKRLRRWPEAIEIWRTMLAAPLDDPLFPVIELAKYYEHRRRDYDQAIALIERLLVADSLRHASPWQADLQHRLARLKSKRQTGQSDHAPGPHPASVTPAALR